MYWIRKLFCKHEFNDNLQPVEVYDWENIFTLDSNNKPCWRKEKRIVETYKMLYRNCKKCGYHLAIRQ